MKSPIQSLLASRHTTTTTKNPMNSLMETRTIVFDRLNQTLMDKEMTRSIEASILSYVKHNCLTKFNMDQLRWSDIRVRRFYLRKFPMIQANLPKIQELVRSGELRLEDVAMAQPMELQPELYQPFLDAKSKREMLSVLVDSEEKHDGILKCDQCKTYKTRYTELQTRGADEPMTVFAMCLECDHHWTLDGK